MEDNKKPVKPREGTYHPFEQKMISDSKLPLTWRMKLDENYAVFRDNLKPGILVDYLTLSDDQKMQWNGMIDDYQRVDYLLTQVLPYGTKDLLNKFKEGLKATEQDHLIPYLPDSKRKRSVSEGDKEKVKKFKSEKSKGRSIYKSEQVKQDVKKLEGDKSKVVEELPIMIHINGCKYVKLMKHQEQLIINIREYITDNDGKLHPTKKGIMLSVKDWQSFKKEIKKVDQHLKQLKMA